jgi:glycerol-1-phosphate dehydrogenase [NAD(P)+]
VRADIIDDGHPVLHADEPVLAAAAKAAAGADCIVSVGSGTITDVAKIAAERAGVPVHVVVQTAASVDGFTDNFAVVLQNGVKKTLLSRWPDAVLTDTRTVAEAPHVLNASGFGELLSMFSAPGDWYIASKLGLDDTFAPVLTELLGRCGEGIADWSAGVGHGDPEASARLAMALAMRGIVTGVGGTTASLSGMEHLFSHMLDLVAAERGAPTGLHGAQVGVGSVIRAAAWEEFCDRMAAERPDAARFLPDIEAHEPQVMAAFAELDPTGRIGAECWSRFRDKLVRLGSERQRLEAFLADWDAIRATAEGLTLGSHRIAAYLHRAGAPKRYTDLDPAVSEELMRWCVANCQFMRERGSVADLLLLAGWWDEAGVARVLARVEAACAAAEAGAS